MPRYIVEMEVYVAPQDDGLMRRFQHILIDRFMGTAVKVVHVNVKPVEEPKKENT